MGKENKEKIRTLIGGQAMLEGVMMRGKTAMALAVRNESGEILLETERIKPKKKLAKVPVIRGVFSFVSSLVLGINTITRSADALNDEDEKLSKGATAFAVVLGLVLALGLFFFLPGFVSGLIYDNLLNKISSDGIKILIKNLISGVLRVGLFITYLALVSLMKDIRRTYMYHGAEHRTINCFEKGLPLTVENVQKCSSKHNRCGTTFMFLVMMISIVVFAFVDWALFSLIPIEKGIGRTLLFMAIKLLFLPLVAGLSYEVLFLFAKLPDNWFTNILRAPGLALQKLTTRDPDDKMAEVAIVAFNAVLHMDLDPAKKTRKFDEISVNRATDEILGVLNRLNAEPVEGQWMLCAVTGKKRSELWSLERLSRKEYIALKELLEKRKKMPLDYCLGTSCFYGRDIAVDGRVLIPRMETEILAETAIRTVSGQNHAVLDLCTGSGCIALTLAKETKATVTAADISSEALAVAAENLKGTNVEIIQGDMFENLKERKFDVIVCNPPYIKTDDIAYLQSEVQCQPHLALDGGEDGLAFYRLIASEAPNHLNAGGILLLEVGFDQSAAVAMLLRSVGGFKNVEIINDLQGIERVIKAHL